MLQETLTKYADQGMLGCRDQPDDQSSDRISWDPANARWVLIGRDFRLAHLGLKEIWMPVLNPQSDRTMPRQGGQ